MTIDILACHGIATSASQRAAYAREWQRVLVAAGCDCTVTAAPWHSTGGAVGDLVAQLLGRRRLREAIDLVEASTRAWLAAPSRGTRLLLGHSWGTVLLREVQRRLAREGAILPLVALASPWGNPVWARAIRVLGGLRCEGPAATAVWNADDDVASSLFFGHERLVAQGWDSVRISLAGRPANVIEEHDVLDYLRHPLTIDAIWRAAP